MRDLLPGRREEAAPAAPGPARVTVSDRTPVPHAVAGSRLDAAPGATPAPPAVAAPRLHTLAAHLLGRFSVMLNDVPVEDWPGGRSRSLCKFLLTHRDPGVPRDVLMETFWPKSPPEAARNSLNVAMHGLRRAFRVAADVPIVVHDCGVYTFHPDLRLWLDMEEFERHVDAGMRLEAADELAGATAEYELAAAFCQGDFVAEEPYEQWPMLTRERLRMAALDTLDRLSRLYFDQRRYAACAALCQQIIDRDHCREDAHRRLMRCYQRQGQTHLALRQFQACARRLAAELGVDPAQATIALHERIRRREPV